MTAPAVTACPTLTTERLVLDAHRADDFEAYQAMWAEPAVYRYIGGAPSPRDEVWARLLRVKGMWPTLGYGFFAIRDRATGAFLGEAGIMEMRREVKPRFEGTPEAGWGLRSAAHSKGLAREAMEAVLGWADRTIGAPRLVCMIHPQNAPSLALAARLGFRRFADTTYKERPALLLERERPA